MAEFNDVTADSKYIFYVGDNESQMTDCSTAFEKLGGTKLLSCEYTDAISDKTQGVLLNQVFLISPPRRDLIRAFVCHGINGKPLAKFEPPKSFVMEDYYFTEGMLTAWVLEYYHHQLNIPYNKQIKTGVRSGDVLINKEYCKEALKFKYGIKTDRPIVLFSPTWNSKSLEFYYKPFIKAFEKDYFFIVRRHDREFFFSPHKLQNVYEYRGLNRPMELIALADYYIGDGSSVDGLAVFGDIPIVMVRPIEQVIGPLPYEFDIRNYVPYFAIDPQIKKPSIVDQLKEAAKPEWTAKRHEYVARNFYFNDGKCMTRFLNAITALVGILKGRLSGKLDYQHDEIMNLWVRQMTATHKVYPIDRPTNCVNFDGIFDNLDKR